MSRNRIAIYGGAFNPIHNGHIEIVKYIIKNDLADHVWVSPCVKHPCNKQLISWRNRLMMCTLATIPLPRVYVSEHEKSTKSNYTYDILKKLKKNYKDYEFLTVIGQDNAEDMKNWTHYKQLIEEEKFIVFAREGKDAKLDWYKKKPNIFVSEPVMNISSTVIRQKIKNKRSVLEYINESVDTFITSRGLYGRKNLFNR